jgi:hypothetical protein
LDRYFVIVQELVTMKLMLHALIAVAVALAGGVQATETEAEKGGSGCVPKTEYVTKYETKYEWKYTTIYKPTTITVPTTIYKPTTITVPTTIYKR